MNFPTGLRFFQTGLATEGLGANLYMPACRFPPPWSVERQRRARGGNYAQFTGNYIRRRRIRSRGE
jgi:hypothetical protein